MHKEKNIYFSLLLSFLFFVLLTFFSRNIPFFWDSSVYCGISHYYFDTNFSSFTIPPELDPAGSPMIYWNYLAIIWKLFGKNLVISHFALLPFLLGIVWEYYKLSKRFLPVNYIPLTLALLLFEPTFVTQGVLMAYDIPMIYFFLLGLNSILQNKNFLLIAAACFLSLSAMRGFFMSLSLFGIHYLLNKEKIVKKNLIYFLSTLPLLLWMFYHYSKTHWWMFSPSSVYSEERHIVDLKQFIRRIIFELWSIFDFGRIFIWTIIVSCIIYLKRKKMNLERSNQLLLFIAVLFICLSAAIVPFSIPLGHKYYIALFLLSNVLALYLMSQLLTKNFFYFCFILLSILLITGNFWIYRDGFSNGWDSSLKVLPYFELKKEMDAFVEEQKINPEEIGTKFPLYHDNRHTYLTEKNFHYSDLKNDSLEKYNYVLLSNVSNQFTVAEKEKLNSNWILLKELFRGEVYLRLLKNPNVK